MNRLRMGGGRGGLRWWPILLFVLYLGYYWVSNRAEVPLTGRSQLVDMSQEQELALGLQSYQQILSQVRLANDGRADQVRAIGQRLVQAAQVQLPDVAWQHFQWQFNLVEDNQANAFCLPGGKVAVYTGILPITANQDGLAVVMGHEIAHAIARHGAERMAHQRLVQMGSMAAGMSVGEMDPATQRTVMAAIGAGAQYGVLLPFSRDHESEADHIGLMIAARACFDPREAPKLWQRMAAAAGGSQSSEFMSTHPSHDTRINRLNDLMPQALAIYQQHCR
ncbi:MAG: M48 family metallopeptidase [Xanthomonadales bacterium]|nr:M48 family metallopeptidase [Xanthomonadales bacterium]